MGETMSEMCDPLMIPPMIKIKYDPSAEPIEDFCSECGKPTGEFHQPHAKDCTCFYCIADRRFASQAKLSKSSAGKPVTFRKFLPLETMPPAERGR